MTALLIAPFWLEAGRLELLLLLLLPLPLLRLELELARFGDDLLRPLDALRLAVLRLAVLRLVLRVPDFFCPPDALRPLVDFDALPDEARVELAGFFAREPLDVVRFRCVPPLDDALLVAISTSPLENVRLATTATQAVREAIRVQAFLRGDGLGEPVEQIARRLDRAGEQREDPAAALQRGRRAGEAE